VARACGDLTAAAALLALAIDNSGQAPALALMLDHARTLRGAGHLRGAEAALHRALTVFPDSFGAHNDAGALLVETGDLARAESHFLRAVALQPGAPGAAANVASLLAQRGQHAAAIAAFDRVLVEAPNLLQAHLGRGLALDGAERFADAAGALRRATAIDPDHALASMALGRALLSAADPAAAAAEARRYLIRHPGHGGALANLALAYLAQKDAAAAPLLDYGRLVRVTRLGTPAGFASQQAFCAALAEHVQAHETLAFAPQSHATQAGQHSGSLLFGDKGPIGALEDLLELAIASYVRALPVDPTHPFIANQPAQAHLDVWGVVLPAGGHQIAHIHPESWLSGVLYVRLPETIRSGSGPAGWLEFGPADRQFPLPKPAPVFRVRPEEGSLVLFPSYLWHRTVAFDGPGTRISIAFDLLRA
jgi:uncharacterized protein (TIGR02466 family)